MVDNKALYTKNDLLRERIKVRLEIADALAYIMQRIKGTPVNMKAIMRSRDEWLDLLESTVDGIIEPMNECDTEALQEPILTVDQAHALVPGHWSDKRPNATERTVPLVTAELSFR